MPKPMYIATITITITKQHDLIKPYCFAIAANYYEGEYMYIYRCVDDDER